MLSRINNTILDALLWLSVKCGIPTYVTRLVHRRGNEVVRLTPLLRAVLHRTPAVIRAFAVPLPARNKSGKSEQVLSTPLAVERRTHRPQPGQIQLWRRLRRQRHQIRLWSVQDRTHAGSLTIHIYGCLSLFSRSYPPSCCYMPPAGLHQVRPEPARDGLCRRGVIATDAYENLRCCVRLAANALLPSMASEVHRPHCR